MMLAVHLTCKKMLRRFPTERGAFHSFDNWERYYYANKEQCHHLHPFEMIQRQEIPWVSINAYQNCLNFAFSERDPLSFDIRFVALLIWWDSGNTVTFKFLKSKMNIEESVFKGIYLDGFLAYTHEKMNIKF